MNYRLDIEYFEKCVPGLTGRVRLAIAGDLHNHSGNKVLSLLEELCPDFILLPGDIFDCFPENDVSGKQSRRQENSWDFLLGCSKIATTIFSLGNHEKGIPFFAREKLHSRGIILLDNEVVTLKAGGRNFCFGGVTSPFCSSQENILYNRLSLPPAPSGTVIENFRKIRKDSIGSCKKNIYIVLSHHPEFYNRYIFAKDFDLMISGHAHGGQMRLGKMALFAPGQGFFPHYTSGLIDGQLLITRGLANTLVVPRFGNARHLPVFDFVPSGLPKSK